MVDWEQVFTYWDTVSVRLLVKTEIKESLTRSDASLIIGALENAFF